jgi:hypothetical protein
VTVRTPILAAISLLAPLALAGCASTSEPHPVTGTPGPYVRYIMGGDSRDDSAHVLPWAFREAQARGATAFFFLGDMELTPSLDEHFRQALPLLGPVAFYPALGNHEVKTFGFASFGHDAAERAFRARFLDTPATPVHSSIANKVVYSVTLAGGVHFVALDNVSQSGFGADQIGWLGHDLELARANPEVRFIIVGMHKPPAKNPLWKHGMEEDGAGAAADSDAALALMVKFKVALLVSSHVHGFGRYEVEGMPVYISGGLGAPLSHGGAIESIHHFLQVDVVGDALKVTVVRFDGKPSETPEAEHD